MSGCFSLRKGQKWTKSISISQFCSSHHSYVCFDGILYNLESNLKENPHPAQGISNGKPALETSF